MKGDHEKQVLNDLESAYRDIGGELKLIKERINYQRPYLFVLMNFLNSMKAIAEYASAEPSKFKYYSKEEIDDFNFEQIETLLFSSRENPILPTANTPEANTIVDEAVLATKAIIADVISPVFNFIIGDEIKFSPEMTISFYGRATSGIRQKISSLKDNDSVVEALAIARLALVNMLTNKAAFLAIGVEPIPDPKWLKNTESYKYSCKISDQVADYLGLDLVKSLKVEKESIEFQTKLYGSKSNKIVNLVLAGLAMRKGGKMLPLVFAAAKVTYSTYSDYLANETNKAIVDEKEHLKKYIDAKNRANFVLEQNPQLERILGLQREDSITINLDEQLTKIYETNPILRSILQANQQEFSSEKEKIIFVQVLKDLVKINEKLKGEYKIWQEGELDISEKKLKIAKMHFTRIYKDKFKRYQQPKQAEVLSSVGKAVKRKLLDSITALYLAIEDGREKNITALTYTLISLFTGQTGKAFLNETKQMKNLDEIAILRMDVPEYGGELDRVGTYKHDLANIAFNKQVEASTLEIIAKRELKISDKEIQDLYSHTKSKVEKDLRKDPLFSDAILNPNVVTKLYDMGTGLLNSLNPWGTKVSIGSKKEKIDSKKTASSVSSTKKTALAEPIVTIEQEDLGSLIPANLLKDIRDNLILRNLKSRSESPTTVTASFFPTGSPKYR